ncbi:hypothetical protein QT972_26885 [Microcoleus sp. herbarium7]|uniref:hypothetical protein n=1 Tax=Microcoleus sp. herbarium7 TaxID=3055435 RepID=UPI002FD47A8D
MKPSRQEVLDNFKRECPTEILETYTDEGLEIILNDIENDERMDGEESEIETKDIYCMYCEESYVECIENLSIKVELTQNQSEKEQYTLMQNAIKVYLEARGALIGFTNTHRVVSTVEIMEETLEEYKAMYFD